MSNLLVAAKRAAAAMAVAGGLVAGAGVFTLWLLDPAPPAQAAMDHAMMDHGAHLTARPAAAAANEIVIDDYSFGPAQLSVTAGTKVVWTNDDPDPHTVTSEADPKVFKSPPLDTGDSFAFTFDKPGTYRYFCTIHPRMRGTVVVE